MIDTIRDALESEELRAGVRFGLPLLAAEVAAAIVWFFVARRWRRAGLVPVAAGAFAAAAALGLDDQFRLPDRVGEAALLAAAGGVLPLVLGWWRPGLAPLGAVALVPAAFTLHPALHPGWVAGAGAAWIVVGGAVMADFEARHRQVGVAPAMLAITVAGAWGTLPDTENVLVLVGAALVALVPTIPVVRPWAGMGAVGAPAALVVLAWVAAIDGRGRPGSVVGALGCLGLFAVEPVTRWLTLGRATIVDAWAATRWGWIPILVGHGVLVSVASRVAGLQHEAAAAALWVAGAGVAGIVLFALWKPAGDGHLPRST